MRQFRDVKGTIALDAMDAAHAGTSGASMIAGYVGGSDKLDRALSRFARAYADQTEADHAALLRAVVAGVLPAARVKR